jgi:hypothetical protein
MSCETCQHYSPKYRYCGGDRPDLANVYSSGHPLKHLPEDKGEGCQVFKINPVMKIGR